MLKRFLTLAIIAIFSICVAFAQKVDSIIVKRERVFTGQALYGFMNGGSDLFLEYGFKELRALEVSYKGEDYSIEIYKMPNKEDAFGIYSLHTFKCINADTLNLYDCLSRFQVQAAVADEYISIVFGTDSKTVKKGAIELLKYFSPKEQAEKVEIPTQFGQINKPISGILKFMRGELAISSVNSDLNFIIKNISNYNIWYLKAKNQGENKVLLFLNDSIDRNIIKTRLPINTILSEGNNYFLFEL